METALYVFKQTKEIGPGWLLDRCEGLTVPVKMRIFGPDTELPLGIQCRGVVVVGLPLPRASFEGKNPALREQQIFVRTLVGLAVPYLGIGYGAQLLATALLGKAQDPADAPLGAATMTLTGDGQLDPLFGGVANPVPVVRWPAPVMTLPKRARLLAGTPQAPDAFAQGECAWALTPHVEVTAPGFSDWLAAPAHAALLANRDPAALQAAVEAQQAPQREAAYRIMDHFLTRVDVFQHDEPPIDVHQKPPGLPDV